MSFALLLVLFFQDPALDEAFRGLREAVEKDEVPGAMALVARKGKILRSEAYGLCDLENRRPFEKNTLCFIASITKPVTVAAAMTLVDEGKIGLDDPVEKYLPEFREQKDKDGRHHPFTIRHLMTHASGLLLNPPTRKSTLGKEWLGQKIEEVVKATASTTLLYVPGTKASYSNAGMYVLARVIETVSGMEFAEFVQRRILGPLGMKDSFFRIPAAEAKRVASCYTEKKGKRTCYFRFDPDLRIVNTSPSGGLFSHPEDLLKFMQMFLDNDGQVLSKKSVEEMLKLQRAGRGLGWALDGEVFRHGGSSGTLAWADPKSGAVGILFFQCNGDRFAGVQSRFVKQVAAALK